MLSGCCAAAGAPSGESGPGEDATRLESQVSQSPPRAATAAENWAGDQRWGIIQAPKKRS